MSRHVKETFLFPHLFFFVVVLFLISPLTGDTKYNSTNELLLVIIHKTMKTQSSLAHHKIKWNRANGFPRNSYWQTLAKKETVKKKKTQKIIQTNKTNNQKQRWGCREGGLWIKLNYESLVLVLQFHIRQKKIGYKGQRKHPCTVSFKYSLNRSWPSVHDKKHSSASMSVLHSYCQNKDIKEKRKIFCTKHYGLPQPKFLAHYLSYTKKE